MRVSPVGGVSALTKQGSRENSQCLPLVEDTRSPQEEGPHLTTLASQSQTYSLQNCEKKIPFACKPPGLWYFVLTV